MRKPTVSANWKMFKTPYESIDFVDKIKKKPLDGEIANIILFAPYTSLFEMGNSINSGSQIYLGCLLYTSPSPRDRTRSRMPSSA